MAFTSNRWHKSKKGVMNWGSSDMSITDEEIGIHPLLSKAAAEKYSDRDAVFPKSKAKFEYKEVKGFELSTSSPPKAIPLSHRGGRGFLLAPPPLGLPQVEGLSEAKNTAQNLCFPDSDLNGAESPNYSIFLSTLGNIHYFEGD